MDTYEKTEDGKGLKIITPVPATTEEKVVDVASLKARRELLVAEQDRITEELADVDFLLAKAKKLKVVEVVPEVVQPQE